MKPGSISPWTLDERDESTERRYVYPNGSESLAARVDVVLLLVWAAEPTDWLMTRLGKAADLESAKKMADDWLIARKLLSP